MLPGKPWVTYLLGSRRRTAPLRAHDTCRRFDTVLRHIPWPPPYRGPHCSHLHSSSRCWSRFLRSNSQRKDTPGPWQWCWSRGRSSHLRSSHPGSRPVQSWHCRYNGRTCSHRRADRTHRTSGRSSFRHKQIQAGCTGCQWNCLDRCMCSRPSRHLCRYHCWHTVRRHRRNRLKSAHIAVRNTCATMILSEVTWAS